MTIPVEITTALTWLAVAGVFCIFTLVIALLLGRGFGGIVEDILRWVR